MVQIRKLQEMAGLHFLYLLLPPAVTLPMAGVMCCAARGSRVASEVGGGYAGACMDPPRLKAKGSELNYSKY